MGIFYTDEDADSLSTKNLNYDVPAFPCLVENSWLISLQPISEILSIGILKQLFFCNITIMRPDKSSKENSIDMNSSAE